MNLKILIRNGVVTTTTQPHLNLPKLLRCQTKGKLVTPSLILEAIDAPQSLCNGNIEDKVSHREKSDGDPTVTTLETL